MKPQLETAKLNGHKPGYIFKGCNVFKPICFCQKCNLPLVYYELRNDNGILGAFSEKCNG